MASTVDTFLTLREICDILATVSHKWWKIGVQLGVPYHKLEEFKKEDDPLAAVINYWLKGNAEDVPVCWKSIITALKSSHIEEYGLAMKISAEYNTSSSAQEDEGATTHPYSESVVASKVSTNTSSGSSSQLSEVELRSYFPYLKDENLPETERLRNIMCLHDESEKLRRKFASLIFDFQKSLENSMHKLEDIINVIMYYSAHDEELAKIEDLLISCKTIVEVFGKLSKYISFFNFNIIKLLINKFGSPEIKKKLKKYKQKFHDYCKHRICECPKDAFGDDEEDMEKRCVLKTELKMTDTLEKLQYAMNKIFLGKKFLRLLHVEEGCVKLTFRILVGLASSLTEEQQQSLRDNGVLNISFGDQQYDLCHLNPTKTLGKPDNVSSADSAYISASATKSATLNSTFTTETNDVNPTEELLKSAEPISVDSRADLHNIIFRGDINVLSVAIERKEYNPLSKDVYGYTALHTAAKYGKLKVMKYLIEEEGINPSIPGPQGTTPLNVAAEAGNLSIVKYLIEDQQDPSADKDEDGYMPLHRGCFTNNVMLVKYLFKKMKEVGYMENKDILCEFTKHDTAPLHIAALHGHLDIVKFFIEKCECDPNLPNKAGRTALFFACENGNLKMVQYLVEVHHCQPSVAMDRRNNTPLHLAAQHGNLSIVQYLTEEKGCDAKCKNNQGNTPLLEASFAGNLTVVKYLIKIGCDPEIRDNIDGYNCLHAACCHGHLTVIQYLIEKQHMDPNIPTRNTKTNSLHIAATHGHEPTVHYLIEERKSDPNCRDENDYTPLHLTAMYNNHLDVIECLLDNKCNLFVTTSRNETPLSLAKAKGNHKVIEFIMLKVGNYNPTTGYFANIIWRGRLDLIKEYKGMILHYISLNKFAEPLIHIAATFGNLEIVKYFIEEGIYKADCIHAQCTPLHMAACCGHIEVFQYLAKECNYDRMWVNATEYEGMKLFTPLHKAVANGHFAMIKHMLECDYGIDPEVQDKDGSNALLLAAEIGHMDIVKYLIDKHKCNVFHRDKSSRTIVHHAAKEGYLDLVKYLINDHKCDPSAKDDKGMTPLHLAATSGRLNIIDYFINDLKINPNIADISKQATALHHAAHYGHLHVVKYLTGLPGCDTHCFDKLNNTPLHFASASGELEIVKYLTKSAKCSHMDQGIQGSTPLHMAAGGGHLEVTRFLIEEMHTPPAVKDNYNQTPLHCALFNGHAEVSLYLIVVLFNECRRI